MIEHDGSPGVPVMTADLVPAAPTAPAVRFGEGRRPETATHVQVAEFDGPLALLLSLIEARQLDVLTVPLGGLADAYLDALAGLDADRLGNVSSFVAVASQLILIKSRAMLPRRPTEDPTALPDEGPDPEAELRARLILYRAHRDAGPRLADGAQGPHRPVPARADRGPGRRSGRGSPDGCPAAGSRLVSCRRWRDSPSWRRRRCRRRRSCRARSP